MPYRGNPPVRVWSEVYQVYRTVAKEWGITVSDLASIVLLYTPIFAPFVIALGLEDNYDVTKEEAIDIARELREGLETFARAMLGGEEAGARRHAQEEVAEEET